MPAWVCACACACVCVRASFAHKPVGQNLHVRACLRYVRPACVCVCAWEHHFRLTALTHTQSVSLPLLPPLEKSTHLPPNGKSMCRQCVQRGSSCATHNHSLSRFLHSNHSAIIIIIVIILVQRSVNVLMTLEWVLHFCCWFRRLTLNCAYYLYIRNQLTISFVY